MRPGFYGWKRRRQGVKKTANEIYFVLPFQMKQKRVSFRYLFLFAFYERKSSFGKWNAIESLIMRPRTFLLFCSLSEGIWVNEEIDLKKAWAMMEINWFKTTERSFKKFFNAYRNKLNLNVFDFILLNWNVLYCNLLSFNLLNFNLLNFGFFKSLNKIWNESHTTVSKLRLFTFV